MTYTPSLSDNHWKESLNTSSRRQLNQALLTAATNGQTWRVGIALDKGASPRFRGGITWKKTIEHGHLETFTYMHKRLADKFSPILVDVERSGLFLHAIQHGQLNIAKYISALEHTSDLERRINAMPISYAIKNNHIDVLNWLIDLGYNVHCDEEMAFQACVKEGKLEPVKYLLSHFKIDIHICDEAAFNIACVNGYTDIARVLLDNGAIIEHNDHYALRMSAYTGKKSMINMLVKHGANINAYDNDVIKSALKSGRIETVHLILSHGAEIPPLTPKLLETIPVKQRDKITKLLKQWPERYENYILPKSLFENKSISDLRIPHDKYKKQNGLILAAKSNRFSDILSLSQRTSTPLTINDFLSDDFLGNTLIDILGARQQLSHIFSAELWKNRLDEMKELWESVPELYKNQIDFPHINQQINNKIMIQGKHTKQAILRRRPPKI